MMYLEYIGAFPEEDGLSVHLSEYAPYKLIDLCLERGYVEVYTKLANMAGLDITKPHIGKFYTDSANGYIDGEKE